MPPRSAGRPGDRRDGPRGPCRGDPLGPGEAGAITFKSATPIVRDAQHEWCERFGARLERRSNGRIKSQVFPAIQLGPIPRMVEGIQLGTVEGFIGPPNFLVGIDPRFQVLTVPSLFEDSDHAYRMMNDKEFLVEFLPSA